MTDVEHDETRFREWLIELADIDVRSGGYPEADILEMLENTIEAELGEPRPALLEELTEKVKAGMAAQEAAERGWEGRTVNDAIESAFAALTERGVLAFEAMGVTVQEGWAIAESLAVGLKGVRGLAFFHRQDLERAVRGEGLYLAFGAWDSAPPAARPPAEADGVVRMGIQRADRNVDVDGVSEKEATAAIGREVVAVLKHFGVETRWDGSKHSRIEIPPFPWRKRRVTTAPPAPAPPPLTANLGAPPPKPPAPPPCPDCQGRGWLPSLQEGGGSDLCWCKGGPPRPSVAPVAPTATTAESATTATPAAAPQPATAAPETPPDEPTTPADEPPQRGGLLGWLGRLFR